MDRPRPKPSRKRRYMAIGVGAAVLLAALIAVSRIDPAVPTVQRAAIAIDSVVRGPMTIEVHASGTLVPEHVRIIAATTAGRVEALPIRPGATVQPNTPIVELSNTDVELQALQSEQQLTAAMGALASLRTSLRQQRLSQEATFATTVTEHAEAARQKAVFDSLDVKELASANEVAASRDRLRELEARLRLERERLDDLQRSERDQLALMEEQIRRLRSIVLAQRERVRSMHVVAGEPGQLQVLPLELGQWVNPGMELARVAQPGRLKAVLRVPEGQAREIVMGQRASIDTRNGVIPGHVMRTDPSSQNGTVTVEVALDGALPAGTRSDLSVDGTIQIERLPDVLHVGRPAYGEAGGTVTIYRMEPGGGEATKATVRLGRMSPNRVQVVSGLAAGDRIIVSDMSEWDDAPRLRVR